MFSNEIEKNKDKQKYIQKHEVEYQKQQGQRKAWRIPSPKNLTR